MEIPRKFGQTFKSINSSVEQIDLKVPRKFIHREYYGAFLSRCMVTMREDKISNISKYWGRKGIGQTDTDITLVSEICHLLPCSLLFIFLQFKNGTIFYFSAGWRKKKLSL